MNEKDDEIAHPSILARTARNAGKSSIRDRQRQVASLCGAFRQGLTLCYGFSDQLISFAALGL
jgi:hypothetical protein